MELDDIVKLGNFDHGELVEIFWMKPPESSPDIMINRAVHLSNGHVQHGISLVSNNSDSGILPCYYDKLIETLPENLRDQNVELPYLDVNMTKEALGNGSNSVQIPLSYIERIIRR